jgi:hypothetical protein
MIAFLKAHLVSVVCVALGVWYWSRQKAATAATLTPADGKKIEAIVITQDPGNSAQYDTDPANYVLADQSYYKGWYRSTKDGSWYNPSSGDFYSAGSSPAAYFEGNATTMPDGSVRPIIDLTANSNASATSVDPTSANNPANGYVIY